MTNQERLDELMRKVAGDYLAMNKRQQEFAIREIDRVRLDIGDLLAEYVGDDGTVAKRRLNRLLRDLEQIERAVRETGMTTMTQVVDESVKYGTAAASGALTEVIGGAAIAGVAFEVIDRDALRYVINRFSDDGLVLSDRVWRLAGEQRDALNRVLRSAIIRGESVNQMTAQVRQVYANETWKIRRLVVTEGATAQRVGESYFADASPVVQALKLHEGRCGRKDHAEHRCHILAHQDPHGLGTGVYKPGDSEPFNPHPNCTSWTSYVLIDKYTQGGATNVNGKR